MSKPRHAWVSALLWALLFGPGCKKEPEAPPASPATSVTAPSATPAAPAAKDPVDDACIVFTKEIAREVLDGEVEGPVHESLTHVEHQRDDCSWHVASSKAEATGTVSRHAYSCDSFVKDMKSELPDTKELTGFGKAGILMQMGSLNIISVCTDTYTLMITAKVSDDKLKAGMTRMLERLPK